MSPEIIFPADTNETLFHLLFQLSGESILFIDKNMKIIELNQVTCTTYKIAYEKLLGADFKSLTASEDRDALHQICMGMGENAKWKGKVNGLDGSGDVFPIQLTIKRMGIDDQIHCCVIIRDLREYVTLKESLGQEKAQRREMYITLRNVMNSIEKEKTGQDKLIAHKIETLIFPALDKIRKEPSKEMRHSYLDFIRD
jgi:PAS domain S-box-containing protein